MTRHDDALLVQQVQAVLDANDPSDGIDRHDGYGRDYRLTDLRLVQSDDGFDDLEVTVREGSRREVRRVLFDRAWRHASGLDDAASCAVYVAARCVVPDIDDEVVDRDLGGSTAGTDELWAALEQALDRDHASLNRVRHGVLEVVDEDGEVVTVHVTPQQWRAVVGSSRRTDEDGLTIALGDLEDQISSRWDDEDHVVFFRGGLHASIRAELPPVRSMLLRGGLGADET